MIGGGGDAAPADYAYNTIASQPFAVSEAQGIAVDDVLYSFGGFDSQKSCCTPTERSYAYDPGADSWSPIADLPFLAGNGNAGSGATHAGIATDGDDIYLVSGYISANGSTGQSFGTKEAYRYDVSEDSYVRLPDLPVDRASGALAWIDGSLHYVSGTNKARTADPTDHYVLDVDGGATTWTASVPLPQGRNHPGAVTLNGRMFVLGGQIGHDGASTTQPDVWSWAPGESSWTTHSDLPQARGHVTSTTFVLDGRIVVAGGMPVHGSASARVDAYDLTTDSWTALTSLPTARASAVAGPLAGGDWLHSTGGTSNGWRVSSS